MPGSHRREGRCREGRRRAGRRRDRRTARNVTLGLLLVGPALLVVRAPEDVLSFVAPNVPVPSDRRQDEHPDRVPEPSRRSGDSVRSDVVTRPSEARSAEQGPEDATPPGRWGAPAPRPEGSAILLEELRGGWRVRAGIEEAVALAVVTAHAWGAERATGGGMAGLGGPGGAVGTSPTPGPIVAVEAVEQPGTMHGVVTLLVVVEGTPHRIAVPVHLGGPAPAVAGAPWPLPAPARSEYATPRPLNGIPVTDAGLIRAARTALDRAGIDGARLVALEATDGWPFIARLEDDTAGHPWLRWHLDRFVVTGLPLDAEEEG